MNQPFPAPWLSPQSSEPTALGHYFFQVSATVIYPYNLLTTDDVREKCDVAAVATCPGLRCGNLALTRMAVLRVDEIHGTCSQGWEFRCPACGLVFLATEQNLLCEALPPDSTLAAVCHA